MKRIIILGLIFFALPVFAVIPSPVNTSLAPDTAAVSDTNAQNEQDEEFVSWNEWRSNIQNQIMKDVNIDYAPFGIVFRFNFSVDKFGNISDINCRCSKPEYNNIISDNIVPAIKNLEHKPILNFPENTNRTSTVVSGLFMTDRKLRYSTPNSFRDYERIK